MHRGAYHDPNAGRETLGAFWEEVRADAARIGPAVRADADRLRRDLALVPQRRSGTIR